MAAPSAQSDFYVPPAPYTAADVIVTDRMTIGADTRPCRLGRAARSAWCSSTGRVASASSIRVSNSTMAGAHITIYRPDGLVLYASGAIGGAGGFIEPQTLPATGSYTVLVDPDSTYTGSLTLSAYDVVDVTGSIAADGTGVPVSIATPGQNARLTFSGTAGQVVTARVTNGTFSSYCFDLSLSIVKSDGTTLANEQFVQWVERLPRPTDVAGDRHLHALLQPDAMQTGTATLTLYSVGDVTGPIAADGTGVPVSITTPGQNARLTFSGMAGQVVTARVANWHVLLVLLRLVPLDRDVRRHDAGNEQFVQWVERVPRSTDAAGDRHVHALLQPGHDADRQCHAHAV